MKKQNIDMENKNSFKETHKDLYGMLMIANQRIDNVGTFLVWIIGMPTFAFCIAVHMKWLTSIWGIPVDKVRGLGVYTFIVIAASILFFIISELRELQIYKSLRTPLLQKIKNEKIKIEVLVTEISEDPALRKIKERIMNDKSIQQKSRGDLKHACDLSKD